MENAPPAKHPWYHKKVYVVAMLLVIAMLVAPLYTGYVAKQKSGEVIFADSGNEAYTPPVSPPTQRPAPMQQQIRQEIRQPVASQNIPDSCYDSDGTDYSRKGILRAVISGNSYSVEDSCNGSLMKEYACRGGSPYTDFYQCPNGCYDGACNP
ncbi:MAG: hypothetical protein QMD85_02605 [Candidatus Aenigmarchaeota archaeon]|nr:hypothetical protein [Candidatus Aenigmarchaeota archaeon]MDI6722437.1 hypothetical protein [Candidatus Aenigmarchaeota archaeon]